MLPGVSFLRVGRIPPWPLPGVRNETYSPIGNWTDWNRQPNTRSKNFRVATGSVLENSEKAIVPSAPVSFGCVIRAMTSPFALESDIQWIVYIHSRGRRDSGAKTSEREGRGSDDLSASCAPSGSDSRERQAARTQVDPSHPAGHGIPETHAIRPNPAEQSRTHSARSLPPTSPDATRRSPGPGREEGSNRVSSHLTGRGRGLHPTRFPAVRDATSRVGRVTRCARLRPATVRPRPKVARTGSITNHLVLFCEVRGPRPGRLLAIQPRISKNEPTAAKRTSMK